MEMALIAPVFLLLIFGVIELGTMLHLNTVLDGAVQDAGRVIRTGAAQQSASALTTFRTKLCDKLPSAVNCASVATDVRAFPNFNAVSLPPALGAGGTPSTTFIPGTAGSIVTIRALYRYEFSTPFIGHLLSGDGSNGRWLMSTIVFRNEPFGS